MKRKSPTQTERLMRALLAGKKVGRYYALNELKIAHPGARINDLRDAWMNERHGRLGVLTWGHVAETVRLFATVRDGKRSYYTIPPAYRKEVREWWNGRAGK